MCGTLLFITGFIHTVRATLIAFSLPLKYNEEIGSITLFPSLKNPSEDISYEDRFLQDPRVCESLLQEGDTGFILTRSGHRLDIVVASHLRGVAKSYEEFLHLKGVMNTFSLQSRTRKSPTDVLCSPRMRSSLCSAGVRVHSFSPSVRSFATTSG